MWLLPSTGRPLLCQEALDACTEAGMTSQGVLYVDGDPESKYLDTIILPPNWGMVHNRERQGLGPVMQWAFQAFPDEKHYGWLADDLRPRTRGFDRKLEEAAGDWGFTCSADGWMDQDPRKVAELTKCWDRAGAMVWGGDLVRAAGSWALLNMSMDVAWCHIASRLGTGSYCPDVMVEHLQYKNGKRQKDKTDLIASPETEFYREGVRELEAWLGITEWSRGYSPDSPMEQMVAKIRKAWEAAYLDSPHI